MSEAEFAAWWNESKHLQDDVFIDVLRRNLATQLQVDNFRRLALVCGDAMLSVDSHWIDAELVVVIRPYSTDPDGEIALVKVARDGDLAAVVNLLERPLNPGNKGVLLHDSEEVVSDDHGLRVTPLQAAVENGHLEVVLCLLQAGADKDKADSGGKTPTHDAAARGHQEVVRCLLRAGADKDKPT
ncbi:unnamed protein product [Effrenium voratum]|nr:unnamed protein product [Effrenium voratum]